MMKINIFSMPKIVKQFFSMKKIFFIGIFLIAILFLTACEQKAATPATGFIGGKDGLILSFLTEDPPSKVYDDSTNPFRISLLLENKGEYDIQPNEVLATIDGIDYDSFSIANPTQKNPGTIERVKKDTTGKLILGGKSVDISFDANYKSKVPASQPFSIGMNVCYTYKTDAITKACLRRDVTSRALATDRCKIEEQKPVSSSGAPVQITSITQRPSGKNQLLFVVNVNNVGKGEVYEPSFISKPSCLSDPLSALQNKVRVKVYFADNKPAVKCAKFGNGNEGTLTLVQGSQRVECLADTSGLQATTYEKAISVQLDYVYKDYLSKSLIVDRSL